LHVPTGGIYATENGTTSNDELNYLISGKNYGWPSLPMGFPGAQVGLRIRLWPDVIVPTGIVFHDGTGWGAGFADTLFLCSYGDERVFRMPMSGIAFTDIDDELLFVEFNLSGPDNKPTAIALHPNGDLYIGTFTGIWKVSQE
ncbi:MAG: sorbosone dehydrogenase family protein, partial [Planctomycetota bacterium]